MGKLSTKNLVDKKVSKILEPGNHTVEILMVKLEEVTYKNAPEGALHLILHCQGPDMGKDFEGFYIDMANPDKGKYKGQMGGVIVDFNGNNKVGGGWSDLQRKAIWKNPHLIIGKCIEVSFMELTDDGNFRHANYEGIKWDK